jgi:quinolinate synthase
MVTEEALAAAMAKYTGYRIVTYVNSSAAIKALSYSCCTSSNAVNIVKNTEGDKILFVPDRNLAHYVARFTNKEILPWNGFCPTHERLRLEDITGKKHQYPEAKVLVHPECRPEVVDMADKALSTSGIIKFCNEDSAEVFIIGTEEGILHRLKKENPEKKFVLASDKLVCPNMKLTSLEDVFDALIDMKNEIHVTEAVAKRAKQALEMMYILNK